MIAAVFFDLDGTLVDSDAARDAAVTAMMPGADVIDCWRDLENRHFDAYLAGEISHAEQRRRRVTDLHLELQRPVPPDWFADYLREYERAWTAFPDAVSTLAGLDRRIGVLTNGRSDQQHAKLQATGLRDYVERLLTSSEIGVAKPAAKRSRRPAGRSRSTRTRSCTSVTDWMSMRAPLRRPVSTACGSTGERPNGRQGSKRSHRCTSYSS